MGSVQIDNEAMVTQNAAQRSRTTEHHICQYWGEIRIVTVYVEDRVSCARVHRKSYGHYVYIVWKKVSLWIK